jgi:hypothetical protein
MEEGWWTRRDRADKIAQIGMGERNFAAECDHDRSRRHFVFDLHGARK